MTKQYNNNALAACYDCSLSAVPLPPGAIEGLSNVASTYIDNIFDTLKRDSYPGCGKKPLFNTGGKKDDWNKCVQEQVEKDRQAQIAAAEAVAKAGGGSGSQESFFERKKTAILIGGAVAAAAAVYFITKK